jgi:hypothetical protein
MLDDEILQSLETMVAEIKGHQVEAKPWPGGFSEECPQPSTIGEVMAWARNRVAEIAGVTVDQVKLDLRVTGIW